MYIILIKLIYIILLYVHTLIMIILDFFYFWGVMYMAFTTLVAIFKTEKYYIPDSGDVDLSIIKTYKLLISIIQLPSVKRLAIIILTVKVST